MNKSYVAPILDYSNFPVLSYGNGSYVFDIEGNKYLDLNGGQFCSVLGHGNQEVAQVVYDTSLKLNHCNSNFITKSMLEAAEAMHEVCGDMNAYTAFFSTGAEANECCLRYAKHLNGNKSGVISFDMGYHGLTHGTEGYSMGRRWVKPQLENSFTIPVPRCDDEKSWKQSADIFESIIEKNRNCIAAALFEPIVSSGGMFFPCKSYWKTIREICTQYGVFLIFDECQTCLGRTGDWFYYQQLDCIPDFVTCAKGIGLGYPVSAVIFNGHTLECTSFDMQHFCSHQNDPLSAELSFFLINYIKQNNLLEKIRDKGKYLLDGLREMSEEFLHFIVNPRGIGLMCGFDLYVPETYEGNKTFIVDQYKKICMYGLQNGIILQGANYGKTIRILPDYLITLDSLKEFFVNMRETIRDYLKEFTLDDK